MVPQEAGGHKRFRTAQPDVSPRLTRLSLKCYEPDWSICGRPVCKRKERNGSA